MLLGHVYLLWRNVYLGLLPFFFFFFKFFLFIYFWLRWVSVAVCGLSLVTASGGYSSLRYAGFSLRWLHLLRSMGSRQAGFSSCFCPFFDCFFFLLLSCMSCLYLLEIKPLLVASFANIFFHSVGCLFFLFTVSFAVQKLISLIRSSLFIFAFISFALGH